MKNVNSSLDTIITFKLSLYYNSLNNLQLYVDNMKYNAASIGIYV